MMHSIAGTEAARLAHGNRVRDCGPGGVRGPCMFPEPLLQAAAAEAVWNREPTPVCDASRQQPADLEVGRLITALS